MPVIYEGINGAVEAKDVSQLTRFKMALVGRPKSGKSWMACTMPGNKYVFDFDNRKASIAGKPDVTVKTYKDTTIDNPKAINELEVDVAMFEHLAKNGKAIPDVFILDSVTHWVKNAEGELMKSVSSLKRTLKFGTKVIPIAAGWDVTNGIRNHTENIICRLSEIGHVICVFHEEPEVDKINSEKDKTVYSGQYVVHPFYLRTLLSTFNEVYRLEVTQAGEYKVTCKPSYSFGASTTLLIDKTETPNIADIIKKHEANLVKLNQNGSK